MSQRAVLLVNLGSPDSTAVPAVRRYLREFLGDERVIDLRPRLAARILVDGLITPFRAPKSAHAYREIWTDEGSPLIVTTERVRDKLSAALGSVAPVYVAMRYGSPSIASVVARIAADGIDEVLLFPQYPHYAMSSWETVVAKVHAEAARCAPQLRIDGILPFYQDPDYIEALYTVTAPYLEQPHDHLLFSYHGIPERHLRKADSSRSHCMTAPDCLVTFANFPTTEYLQPRDIDFVCFNVYLHDEQVFRNYLARLQSIAGDKPLMLGEYGIDTHREKTEEQQAAILGNHVRAVFDEGLAGTFIFSFTDDWYTHGWRIEDWKFGIVKRDRSPKAAFHVLKDLFHRVPQVADVKLPKMSVIICSYNGASTVESCLSSMQRLRYPDYEVVFVDDGSKDHT